MTSPLVEGYWTLDKHPGGPRGDGGGQIEHLLSERVSVHLCVNTDLNSSEDAVCVYVVLGADQYRRWGSYWVRLKAARVSTVEHDGFILKYNSLRGNDPFRTDKCRYCFSTYVNDKEV